MGNQHTLTIQPWPLFLQQNFKIESFKSKNYEIYRNSTTKENFNVYKKDFTSIRSYDFLNLLGRGSFLHPNIINIEKVFTNLEWEINAKELY